MTKPYSYDDDDPNFVADLYKSQKYAELAATWLRERGLKVKVNKLRVRPDSSQMAKYADNGDLEVTDRCETVRVEAKHRPKINFTCASDFPYPTAIVDVAHHWEKANPKPYAYIIFNAPATHFMIVRGETSHRWTKERRYDVEKKRHRTFLECPIELCKFRVYKEGA